MRNLTFVIFIFLAFTLGCGRLSERFTGPGTTNTSTGNSSSSGQSTSTVDKAPPSGDPREDVVQASKRFLELPKFRANMQGRGTTDLRIKMDYVAPNKFHIYFLDNNGQVKTESVMIGGDMYMNFNGRWQKIPGAQGENAVPNLRNLFNEEGLKTLKEVKYEGDDTLDGQPAHVYSYRNNQTNSNMPYPFTSKIWVAASDALPHKIEVTYEGGELKTMTIVYDYTADVVIEPPVK